METKKITAALVVAMMALSGLVCLVSFQPDSEAATVTSAETAVLHADQLPDSDDNVYGLSVLGLTPESWQDGVLVFDNLNFKTTASCAVHIVADSKTPMIIEVRGTCSLFCSYDKTEPAVSGMDSVALWSGQNVVLTIRGAEGASPVAGHLSVKSDVNELSESPKSSYGICSEEELTISACKVNATSGNISSTKSDLEGSFGIFASPTLNVTDGASVFAKSGNVDGGSKGMTYDSASAGIAVKQSGKRMGGKIVVSGTSTMESYLYGEAGNVTSPGGFSIASLGVYCDGAIELNYGVLHGYAGAATDNGTVEGALVESVGIWCSCDIAVKNSPSEITAVGNDAKVYKGDVISAGMNLMGDIDTTVTFDGASLYCVGGEITSTTALAEGDKYVQLSAGIEGRTGDGNKIDFVFKNSVVKVYASAVGAYQYSCGVAVIDVYDQTLVGTITVDDSEVSTNCYAFWCQTLEITNESPRKIECNGTDITGSGKATWISTIMNTSTTTVKIIYSHVVNIIPYDTVKTPILSVRVTDGYFVLPECEYLPQESGVHFKCWEINGVNYKPGDAYYFTDEEANGDVGVEEIVVNAVWEKDSSSTDSFAVMAIAAAVATLGVVGFLVALVAAPKH